MSQPEADRTEPEPPDDRASADPSAAISPPGGAIAPPLRRRWYQFSLWTLFALTLLAAVLLMGWRWTIAPYRAQADTMARVERLGGSYQSQPAPQWMSRLAGQELGDVTLVNLADCDQPDEYVAAVARLPRLEILAVGGQAFGVEQVGQLSATKSLRWLILDSTNVSADALAALQDANPDLQVYRSQRRTIAAITAARGRLEFRKNDDYRELHALLGADFFDEPHELDASAANALLAARVRSLRGISLYGAISDAALIEIARMPNLESLYLDEVTDDGLRLLSGMKLKHLAVGGTITDAGLANLAEMKSLTSLALGETKITDFGLAHLARLTNLEALSAEHTMITDAGMSHLAGLTKLRWLRVPSTKVGDAGLAHLAHHKELEYLFPGNVTDAGLAHLAGMSKLKHLVIGGPGITDQGLAALKAVPNLEQLSLSGAQITDAGLSQVTALARLQRLNLNDTPITDTAVDELAKLTSLTNLDLRNTAISDGAVAPLAKLTSLTELDVRNTRLTPGGAARLQKALPGCKVLWGVVTPWKAKTPAASNPSQ